ncbi:hypothetical protein AURDEDRAFT_117016 [Auricularia subglabra TFB-10046 SS5]|uniref:Stealth protein CR3 conserved region 3 domain-containing protein n=1 Tax=Auricularia subglabra (strain TFB-10046 / SS5) TaxID=717982 RepID=J0D9W5_AURST|nr:hypothetical protein AURDEDRAFT_117016 [Auricularia subglabra TFB-10046 SS5]
MVRPRGRFVAAGGALVVSTGALYLWMAPDAAQEHWRTLQSSFSSSSGKGLSPLPPVVVQAGDSLCDVPLGTDVAELITIPDGRASAQYRLIHAPSVPSWPTFRPLQFSRGLPPECLDKYVGAGKACRGLDTPLATFDFVWTWSNGSEGLHRSTYLAYERSTLPVGGKSQADQPIRLKLFREHDELRHSLRSVLQHFRPFLNSIHLVTGDLPVPDFKDTFNAAYDEKSEPCPHSRPSIPRLGQVPTWLNISQPDGDVRIDVTHHSQFFSHYTDTVFNSLAIESQFPNLPNLHEHFIYMNDDFFFSANLVGADFYTDAFGTVFRVYPSRVIQPASERDPNSPLQATETVALEKSSEIISRRFGYRSRPYPSHESKVVATPLFRELAALFPEALAESARARVRSVTGSKVVNVHMMALYLHFVVERHREAVLWSWAVARLSQVVAAGREDWAEVAWKDIGGTAKSKLVDVKARRRATLDKNHTMSVLGEFEGAYAARAYRFSSEDGYPYASLGDKGRKSWPDMKSVSDIADGHPHFKCRVVRQRCFPTRDDIASGYSPVDLFKHIAFFDIACGDCIMTALVAQSGDVGLSAVLPKAGGERKTFDEPPHLPLVADWTDGNFSVESVVPAGADLRAFSTQLIHRYRYVLGRIFSGFSMLKNPQQAADEFKRLNRDIKSGWMGVVCVNDDIVKGAPEVDKLFRGWQEDHWPNRAQWEIY